MAHSAAGGGGRRAGPGGAAGLHGGTGDPILESVEDHSGSWYRCLGRQFSLIADGQAGEFPYSLATMYLRRTPLHLLIPYDDDERGSSDERALEERALGGAQTGHGRVLSAP